MDTKNFTAAALPDDELVALIEHHNALYWQGVPELSDPRYDELVRELTKRRPDHPLLSRIDDLEVSSLGKVIHRQPMLSLDKAYSLDEVLEWARKLKRSDEERLLVQPKYDGLSAVFDGRVLATRGDGAEGENITDKLPLIRLETAGGEAPLSRPVRGEILVRSDKFELLRNKIQRLSGQQYKNSRNILAGLLRLVNSRDIAQVELGMRQAGAFLSLVDYNDISYAVRYDELAARWPELLEEMEQLPYPLDGIVIKLADERYRRELGNTAHHPRGEIAFKFSNLRRHTTLLGVEWSFGKSALTPVALLDPVEINGTTIRRASLHNVQNLLNRDIEIGDGIMVERAGDVIPYIVGAEPGEARRSPLIEVCPDPRCATPLIRRGPEAACPNPDCPGTRLELLAAAVRSIGIDNLGKPTVEQMMTRLKVRTLADVFKLTIPDLMKLDGFTDRKPKLLLDSIRAARRVNDFQLLAALNIPHVGVNVARDLLKRHSLAELRRMSAAEFAAVPGLGPERAAALSRELARQSDFLDELLTAVEPVESRGAAQRETVCFTGKMPEKRDYYARIAAVHGFDTVDEVNSHLTMLVAAEPDGGSTKLKAARRQQVPILGLDAWLERYPAPPAEESAADDLFAAAPPPVAASADPEQMSFDF